jgi:hypothetical protein
MRGWHGSAEEETMHRVRYLAAMAVVAGVSVGADAWPAGDQRPAGGAGIEIDGVRAAVKEASGGAAFGDAVSEKLGPDHVVHKHVGGVQYEEIALVVGADMPKPLASWTTDTLNLRFAHKSGAILGLDGGKEVSRRAFTNGLLTDVVFPELDASSKDVAYITVKISPEYTRLAPPNAAAMTAQATPPQKMTMASAFRLQIDGLDTSRVSKIEALDVKMKVGTDPIGEQRDYTKAPVNLEIPNLVFYVSESHADSIAKWHEDFVVKGNNGQDKEKNGRIDLLSSSGQAVYSLELQHLGITHFTPEPYAADDATRKVRVEMYVEQMKFTPGTMAQ